MLICLREKKAQEARCLEDLLPCDATTNMKELLAAIGEGEGMLIVCDGFDELPHERRQKGSVYIDLLKGRLLPEATIIVTSRPSVSAELWRLCQHNIGRHLEVIGFTKEDIKWFAESVFSGNILAGFLSYINSNPPIYGMMYVPLNAVIVALIYQDSYDTDTPFPTTMTQLFDALTRALIRRHLMSTRQVPSEYCMPPSLQRTEDISKLPALVPQQLLQLAKVAYESLCEKRYIFTDLGEDFEHLGTMKKTTSVNVCTGPGCSYSFLHLTLQEYLTALHIVIVNPSGFERFLERNSVVVRFLAGMYRHDDYHSHPVYQKLVKLLANNQYFNTTKPLQLVHCAYECPSIMDDVKVHYIIRDTINVSPVVGFDWYLIGYCITNFDERWEIHLEEEEGEGLDFLMKGIKSSSTTKGKIFALSITSTSFSSLMLMIGEFCQLTRLKFICCLLNDKDKDVLKQLIAPGSRLKELSYYDGEISGCFYDEDGDITCYNNTVPLLFQHSSVQVLRLGLEDESSIETEALPHENTNLKRLTISSNLLDPLAALIMNIRSLTYLGVDNGGLDRHLPVLTNIVQSTHTLEVLDIFADISRYLFH